MTLHIDEYFPKKYYCAAYRDEQGRLVTKKHGTVLPETLGQTVTAQIMQSFSGPENQPNRFRGIRHVPWDKNHNKGFPSDLHIVKGHPLIAASFFDQNHDLHFYEVIPDMAKIVPCPKGRGSALTYKTESYIRVREITAHEPEAESTILREILLSNKPGEYQGRMYDPKIRICALLLLTHSRDTVCAEILQSSIDHIDVQEKAIAQITKDDARVAILLELYQKTMSPRIRKAIRRELGSSDDTVIRCMWKADAKRDERNRGY